MKQAYMAEYYPPMPVLSMRLGYPAETLLSERFPAIIDTGADITLVPLSLLDDIAAPMVTKTHIRSQWGERRTVTVFAVDIEIAGLRLPSIEVIGDERGREIVLGRNVLNKLKLLLNGPQRYAEVIES